MKAGKPQDQSLAIAYSVKRKAKKASGGSVQSGSKDMNMADGGAVSANNEKRPMPENKYNDAKNVASNSGDKPSHNDSWTGRPTVKQSQSPGGMRPQKHPRMVEGMLSTKLRDQEGRLIEEMPPASDKEQPSKAYDEKDASKKGPDLMDKSKPHSDNLNRYAKGGPVMQPKDHGIQEMEREDESHLMDSESPSEDEGASEAHSMNEEDPDRQGPDSEDLHMKMMADGGEIGRSPDDSENQGDMHGDTDEYDDSGKEDSIAAAIMARRARLHAEIDSGAHDMDHAVSMAEGGRVPSDEISSHPSIYSDDSDQADLSRNADEDANEEDQLSFNALTKENYSESDGLRRLDQPRDSNLKGDSEESDSENKRDRVSAIRSKMMARRQFKR